MVSWESKLPCGLSMIEIRCLTGIYNQSFSFVSVRVESRIFSDIKAMSSSIALLLCILLSPHAAHASWGWPDSWNGEDCNDGPWNRTDGSRPWWADGHHDRNTTTRFGQDALAEPLQGTMNSVLIAHAVLACLAWVLFFPMGGILLRLPAKSSHSLRGHVICQLLTYILYLVAAGLGIWLVQRMSYNGSSVWSDPHPCIGVVILIVAFFQPIMGYVHHRIFKRKQKKTEEDKSTAVEQSSSTTVPGFMHVWTGRALIILAIVNGGLGIRLASRSPYQSGETTQTAVIGYSIGAGIMLGLYFVCIIMFARRRTKQAQEHGTAQNQYRHSTCTESVESLEKPPIRAA